MINLRGYGRATNLLSPKVQGYSMVCTIGAASAAQAPYLIHNACTNHVVFVRQKESALWHKDNSFLQIMPRSAPLPFAWDDTMTGHKLVASILPASVSSDQHYA